MNESVIPRRLTPPERSFFLFGPRGAGKSTWLRYQFPDAAWFDLLESGLYLELSRAPSAIESIIGNRPPRSWVVIDEIQKVPELLDEVHRLMESRRWRFALCGSSARKLLRRGTNLLGGRAVTRRLEGFSSSELGARFDPEFSIDWGCLPAVQLDRRNAADTLNSYVHTYIREEIKEEGIVRRVPPFVRFLAIAGLMNGQLVNLQNIAREAAVPRSTVDVYFSILEDTLLGYFLPAYRPSLKVRERAGPKFYWFDPGVARAAAGLLFDPADRTWRGTALECLICHELRVYNHTANRNRQLGFYRSAAGAEIDFIVETRKRTAHAPACVVCIEAKMADKWDRKWERAARSLKEDAGIRVERMIGVYMGKRAYHYEDFDVLPLRMFLDRLYAGDVF